MSVDHKAVLCTGWLVSDEDAIKFLDEIDFDGMYPVIFEPLNAYSKDTAFFFGVEIATCDGGAKRVVEDNCLVDKHLMRCIDIVCGGGFAGIIDVESPGVFLLQEVL